MVAYVMDKIYKKIISVCSSVRFFTIILSGHMFLLSMSHVFMGVAHFVLHSQTYVKHSPKGKPKSGC